MNTSDSLCKNCKFRFRRVWIPLRPDMYVDDSGESVMGEDNENILIVNSCIISGLDLDEEVTIECSHFEPREESPYGKGLFKQL